jgi:hypothetical protein
MSSCSAAINSTTGRDRDGEPYVPLIIGTGFRGQYEAIPVRANSDATPDIYVRPAAGNTDSDVPAFVMMSDQNGRYHYFLPYAGWNLAAVGAASPVVLGDFDADGRDDMIIKNIAGVQGNDVIAFAPRFKDAIPGNAEGGDGYVRVDAEFRQFFDELYHSTAVEPGYVESNTEVLTIERVSFRIWVVDENDYCDTDDIYRRRFHICRRYRTIEVEEIIEYLPYLAKIVKSNEVLGNWHPSTNLLRCKLWCSTAGTPGIFDQGELVAGSVNGKALSDAMSYVLGGRPFMGGVLDNVVGSIWDDYYTVGERARFKFLELLWWERFVLNATSDKEYVICSKDEGPSLIEKSLCSSTVGVLTRADAVGQEENRQPYLEQEIRKLEGFLLELPDDIKPKLLRKSVSVIYDKKQTYGGFAVIVPPNYGAIYVEPLFFTRNEVGRLNRHPEIREGHASERLEADKAFIECIDDNYADEDKFILLHELMHTTSENIDKAEEWIRQGGDNSFHRADRPQEVHATQRAIDFGRKLIIRCENAGL